MFTPWSAMTRSTRSSVPGSLRTAKTIVVRGTVATPGGSAGTSPSPAPSDREPGPVAGLVADLVGEDLEPEEGGDARRRIAAAPRSARRRSLSGAGGVVGRQDLPWPAAEERVGLGERLGVAVDALDSSIRWPGSATRHRRTGTPTSPSIASGVELEQQVVGLADRAGDELSIATTPATARPDATASNTARQLPSGPAVDVAEVGEHRFLAERARLALEGDALSPSPADRLTHRRGPGTPGTARRS